MGKIAERESAMEHGAGESVDLTAFVLSTEHRVEQDRSRIVFYGKSARGPVRVSASFEPYFFVEDGAPLPERFGSPTIESGFRALAGHPVRRVAFPSVPAAEAARVSARSAGLRMYESDVRPRDRFFMDRRLNGGVRILGGAERRGRLLCFRNPTLEPSDVEPQLMVCSLDIETSVSNGTLLSIGVHLTGGGTEVGHVFMKGSGPTGGNDLSYHSDEGSLLRAFTGWFEGADPDIVIGWNVVGFDLSFLARRASTLGVPLRLGREDREMFLGDSNTRFPRVVLPGRAVLDGPQLLKTSFFQFESYSLESVSRAVLGEGKLIAPDRNRAWEIERLFERDKPALAAYNLKDCVLVSRIFSRLQLMELTVRRSELTGQPLDRVNMSTASFDHFYLPRLHDAGFVAPDLDDIGEVTASGGGHVMEPVPGLYDDVVSLDFQSL